MEAVRAMLFHRKLPEALWGEAANVAAYTFNRVTNSNSKDKTPFELYFGRRPRISHLRVFRSICFMKAQEQKRSGHQRILDPRSSKLILVGYDRDFTYCLFEPQTNKIYITREVLFDERKLPDMVQLDNHYQSIDEFLDELPLST